jgi:hypothetical protein
VAAFFLQSNAILSMLWAASRVPLGFALELCKRPGSTKAFLRVGLPSACFSPLLLEALLSYVLPPKPSIKSMTAMQ